MQNPAPTHDLKLANRLVGINLSEIVEISERAAQRRAAGQDIVSLSTGEPDLPTPDHIIDAANAAAHAGQTRYTATTGTPELRAAVAHHAGVAISNGVISTGAKQVIANAMMAALNVAALCAWLLDTAGVAIVPGRAFGLPGHVRLSFAYSDADLSTALARISDALERKTQ